MDHDAANSGIYARSGDTVVTVTAPASPGDLVTYQSEGRQLQVTALADIPIYHKLAVAPAKKGDLVIKYGERIGVALCDIQPGEHVHTHNLGSYGEEQA
jgi:altronate dehydratase small subunit